MKLVSIFVSLAVYGVSLLPLVLHKDPNRSHILKSQDRIMFIILSANVILPILVDFLQPDSPVGTPIEWLFSIAWLVFGIPSLVIFGIAGFVMELIDLMKKQTNILKAFWSVSFLSLVYLAVMIFLVLSFPETFS